MFVCLLNDFLICFKSICLGPTLRLQEIKLLLLYFGYLPVIYIEGVKQSKERIKNLSLNIYSILKCVPVVYTKETEEKITL